MSMLREILEELQEKDICYDLEHLLNYVKNYKLIYHNDNWTNVEIEYKKKNIIISLTNEQGDPGLLFTKGGRGEDCCLQLLLVTKNVYDMKNDTWFCKKFPKFLDDALSRWNLV